MLTFMKITAATSKQEAESLLYRDYAVLEGDISEEVLKIVARKTQFAYVSYATVKTAHCLPFNAVAFDNKISNDIIANLSKSVKVIQIFNHVSPDQLNYIPSHVETLVIGGNIDEKTLSMIPKKIKVLLSKNFDRKMLEYISSEFVAAIENQTINLKISSSHSQDTESTSLIERNKRPREDESDVSNKKARLDDKEETSSPNNHELHELILKQAEKIKELEENLAKHEAAITELKEYLARTMRIIDELYNQLTQLKSSQPAALSHYPAMPMAPPPMPPAQNSNQASNNPTLQRTRAEKFARLFNLIAEENQIIHLSAGSKPELIKFISHCHKAAIGLNTPIECIKALPEKVSCIRLTQHTTKEMVEALPSYISMVQFSSEMKIDLIKTIMRILADKKSVKAIAVPANFTSDYIDTIKTLSPSHIEVILQLDNKDRAALVISRVVDWSIFKPSQKVAPVNSESPQNIERSGVATNQL